MSQEQSAPQATIRFETSAVTPEEMAAVVAVLSATGGGGGDSSMPRSEWAGRARVGWRTSGLPAARFVERLPR